MAVDLGVLRFGALDYVAFGAMITLSGLVGVYFGCYKKQDTMSEYYLGGKSMRVFPIAMSLIASNISGVTMLGVPGEIYAFGTQLSMLTVICVPIVYITVTVFLPTFYRLQYASSYEYLEHRFNKRIRTLTSTLYTIGSILYIPVVMYVPCLALHQVSGITVHLISPITCLVCIFYTCLGGLKAVVWTDALQLASLIVANVIVVVLGAHKVGGLSEVWRRNDSAGRLEFLNLDFDLTARCTFWGVVLGEGLNILSNVGTSPSSVQRYICLPSYGAAKRAAWVLAGGMTLTRLLSCATGFVMFAHYHDCDPLQMKVISARDKLLPHFIMDVTEGLPGLSGIFIAGVFSASLSTMSSVLNTLSGTIYKDFLELRLPRVPDERQASRIMKVIVLLLGCLTVALVFVVEQLGSVFEAAISLIGITTGALFGLFLLGFMVPWSESRGAECGAVASLLLMMVVYVGSLYARVSGALRYDPLPTRIDGCLFNSTLAPTAPPPTEAATPSPVYASPLFLLSPFYYTPVGVLVTVLVGSAVSLLVRRAAGSKVSPDPDLLAPPIARFLRKRQAKARSQDKQYDAVATTPL